MKNLNLLMIPTDYCNMHCRYCFFNKDIHSSNFMKDDILQHLMKITLPYYDRVSFIWHGGEPLSLGIDFYRKVIELQNEYTSKYPVHVSNSIQSNFTLLTPQMVDFFHKHNFGLSTSFDGVKNELTRGSSNEILNGINLCFQRGIHCGAIMIASKLNIDTLIDSYDYFKSKHIGFRVNPYLGNNKELKLDYSLFAEKMIELFDYWAIDSNTNIGISSFIEMIDYVLFKKKYFCSHSSCLGRWASVNYNGTIKPCNRFFPDEYSFGNIFQYSNFNEAFASEGFKKIITKAIYRREKCKSCSVYDFCCGGCNYVASIENGDIENNNGGYCIYIKKILSHIQDFFNHDINTITPNKYIKKRVENLK